MRWLPGSQLQTIVPAFWPVPELSSPTETELVTVEEGSAVGIDINRPQGRPRGTVLLIHGMGGCSTSAYMLYTALCAVERGWVAVRMNLRNCGGHERHARTLYNAGQSQDAERVLEAMDSIDGGLPRPFLAAGFSMGGNLLLRYAGLQGVAARADAVVGVNAPVDLERCLLALEFKRNWHYQTHFIVRLCGQLRRILQVRPLPGPPPLARKIRTLRRFDTLYTAPDGGYRSVDEYYAVASAGPHLSKIRKPALILSPANDPLVPVEMFESHHGNPALEIRNPVAGGHCGWQPGSCRSWVGQAILDWFEQRS